MKKATLFLLLLFLCRTEMVQSQPKTLFAAVLETRDYVVGSANPPSGLFRYEGMNGWRHLGWSNIRLFGLAPSAGPLQSLYMAAGNGVLRSRDGGATWRVTTGWRVTEVLDVAVDPGAPAAVYAATARGIWRSSDGAETWAQAGRGLPMPAFTAAVAVDRHRTGRILAGTEEGLFVSNDHGSQWQRADPAGVPVRDIKQSVADPDLWLAGTEKAGLLASRDGGRTWARVGEAVIQGTVYAAALDPADARRMAAGGFQSGVFISIDGGATWHATGGAIDGISVHALAFDPVASGRLWAGTVGHGIFYTDDLGATWQAAGLEGASIMDLVFVEETP